MRTARESDVVRPCLPPRSLELATLAMLQHVSVTFSKEGRLGFPVVMETFLALRGAALLRNVTPWEITPVIPRASDQASRLFCADSRGRAPGPAVHSPARSDREMGCDGSAGGRRCARCYGRWRRWPLWGPGEPASAGRRLPGHCGCD